VQTAVTVAQIGVQVGAQVYNAQQDRKLQESMASSANDTQRMGLVTQFIAQDQQLKMEMDRFASEKEMLDREVAALDAQIEQNKKEQAQQLDYVRQIQSGQLQLSQEEKDLQLAIIAEKQRELAFNAEMAEQQRKLMRAEADAKLRAVQGIVSQRDDIANKAAGKSPAATTGIILAAAAAGAFLLLKD
jgi:DNA anti-recombination protein RmuC